jgi:hypothetical protein
MRLSLSANSEGNDAASRLVAAADALGASDAQRCVVLQWSAIERTALEVQRRQFERRAEARKLLDEFHRQTAEAKQVLEQLQAGEATLLELWLLARPKS